MYALTKPNVGSDCFKHLYWDSNTIVDIVNCLVDEQKWCLEGQAIVS
jgi:hypothetical protein